MKNNQLNIYRMCSAKLLETVNYELNERANVFDTVYIHGRVKEPNESQTGDQTSSFESVRLLIYAQLHIWLKYRRM